MQVVRLMKGGHVDRIIAFDSLPKRFFDTAEKVNVDLYRFPKHWSKFGVQEDGKAYHYVFDYVMINKDKETWAEITGFVRRSATHVVKHGGEEKHIADKLEDMAVPMASNSKEAMSIDVDDIPVIVIPEHLQEKPAPIVVVGASAPIKPKADAVAEAPITCIPCAKEFKNKKAFHMHNVGKHRKELVSA